MRRWWIAAVSCLGLALPLLAQEAVSPSGQLRVVVEADADRRLTLTVQDREKRPLVCAKLGMVVGGKDLGAVIQKVDASAAPARETVAFEWHGHKRKIEKTSDRFAYAFASGGGDGLLEVKMFDDGVAFRYKLPQTAARIDRDTTSFVLADDTRLWYKVNKPQYEMVYQETLKKDLPEKFNAQLPVTARMADGRYLAIAEAGGFDDWPGLSLVVQPDRSLQACFADEPKGFTAKGDRSAWWVVMTGPDLNGLVNNDIIPAVTEVPGPAATELDWIKGGRCLWQWWAYNDPGTEWNRQKWFVDQAAALNCQYYLVDAGWENPKFGWVDPQTRDAWAKLKELVAYAAAKQVGILVWRPWTDGPQGPGVQSRNRMERFLSHCQEVGVKGVKIDYWASESLERRGLMSEFMKLAAEHRILVNFHGCAKPSGEQRRYPMALTREGIRGLEHNKWDNLKPEHYCQEPFLRGLAGNADFTPTTLQKRSLKGTTVSFQMASPVIFTSPFLTWADKPDLYLASPALPFIREMPYEWDETIVLPSSEIGKRVVMARRCHGDWWVAAINGGSETTVEIPLDFLSATQDYSCSSITDVLGADGQPVVDQMQVTPPASLADRQAKTFKIPAGGGVLLWFKAVPGK